MKKVLKYFLWGVGVVFGVLALGVAYIAVVFDPNDYKEQIVKAVKESKQRDLLLDGDIKLHFFPSIGVDLGRISLSEYQSPQPFAAVERVSVSLAVLPLLSKQVVVDEVVLSGLSATVVKRKDGSSNIDDLLGKPAEQPAPSTAEQPPMPIRFDVKSVAIDRTGFTYRDEGNGSEYAIKEFALHTGRVAAGIPVKLDLSARISATQPKLELDTQLHSTLTFDLDKGLYQLQGLDWKVNGSALAYSDVALQLGGDIKADTSAKQYDWTNLLFAASARGGALPSGTQVKLNGEVHADLAKQTLNAGLGGNLLQSQLKAKAEIAGFDQPAIRYDLEIDQFDADAYLPKKAEQAPEPEKKAAPEKPFDLSPLKTLNVKGSMRLGMLKVANVKLAQIRIDTEARNGKLDVPLSAQLYDGGIKGKLAIDAATSRFTIDQKLANVDIALLLKDALNLELVEGKGNIDVNLVTQGNRVSALKKGLNGALGMKLAGGAIRGIDLGKLAQGVSNLGKNTSVQTLGVNKNEKTAFDKFEASFKVRDGIARNDDLAISSSVLQLNGNGDVDIGNDKLNYTVKAKLTKPGESGGITLPVQIIGPYADLKFKVDYGALVSSAAKQKVDAKVQEVKNKLQEDAKAKLQNELQKGLKGLFK